MSKHRPSSKPVEIDAAKVGQKLHQTTVLVLLALVSITAATYAWFSLSANTRVQSMNLEITGAAGLRIDVAAHDTFEGYVKTLDFEQIYEQVRNHFGYDAQKSALEPLTTSDGIQFQTEKGIQVLPDTGKYLEFTLHFRSTKDMIVHLTGDNSAGKQDGTLVQSKGGADEAMRISFTAADSAVIYEPRGESQTTFTLATEKEMRYNDENALFSLKADTDTPVTVRVWLEGTDESCTDKLRGADYNIRLRFAGTDENGQLLE